MGGWLVYIAVAPELDGFLTTSVVLPPDSEIVAPFSVSGIRPNGCALVEPSRTEEYGVIVGHTLVDASAGTPRGNRRVIAPFAGGLWSPTTPGPLVSL